MSFKMIRNKQIIPLLIVLLVELSLISCGKENSYDSVDEIKDPKYENFIQQAETYLTENDFHGSVLVAKGNSIIYAAGFGSSDVKNPKADNNTIHTTYEIGSVTKQMTAASIMKLVEQNKLSLNQKLSDFFPGYVYGNDITIEMLLNMRSGLTDYINSADDFFPRKVYNQIERYQISNRPLDSNIVLKHFYDAPLLAKPDSTFFYCNTNYYLLACIIEQLTNKTYSEFVTENILVPCGMNETNLQFQNTSSRGYDYKGRYYSIPQALSKGCGDVNSTVIDVYRWNKNFYNGKVVSKKSFKQMTNSKSYGYGIYCSPDSYFHGGNTNVFNAFDVYYPKEMISIIVLSNEPINRTSTTIFGRNLYKIYKNSNK